MFLVRAFPEREVLLRAEGRVRFIRLGLGVQLAAVALTLVLVPGAIYGLAKNFIFQDAVIAAKTAELNKLASAYDALKTETAESQKHYRIITQQLETKHSYLLKVMEQNQALQADLGQTRGALKMSEAERLKVQAAREALLARLDQLDGSLKTMAAEKETMLGSGKTSDRQQAVTQRARADELQERLIALQLGQQEVLKRLSARTAGSIGELKDLIAMTGLNADRLLAGITANSGLGGPFVEFDFDRDEPRVDSQLAALSNHIDQWDELQQVMRRLPLSPPVDNYVTMSPYGKRRDPLNGQLAMHYGVDLGGPPKAPILSPAPGVVVFVGNNGNYGRMVEIDHGMGIRTRYGHLSSVSVRKGQSVGYRQPIGIIGTTGRSTGVHLHYEVLVNDAPHDPMRFIQAGKHVFKG
jgi:murein DD-endopeptidase MepM/ murein hydrolase activator NlpD